MMLHFIQIKSKIKIDASPQGEKHLVLCIIYEDGTGHRFMVDMTGFTEVTGFAQIHT